MRYLLIAFVLGIVVPMGFALHGILSAIPALAH